MSGLNGSPGKRMSPLKGSIGSNPILSAIILSVMTIVDARAINYEQMLQFVHNNIMFELNNVELQPYSKLYFLINFDISSIPN